MLNKDGNRELCYLAKIENVIPHPNADRLDIAEIGGWRCIVGKDEFKAGDIGIYFEVDSKLPECKPFVDMEFLASKHYKVKIQKIRGEYSQGLLMSLDIFNGTEFYDAICNVKLDDESKFLTNALKVTYAIIEDNKRKSKSNPDEKYNRMARRHPQIARQKWFRWLMKRDWGKRLLFVFFGKKKNKPKNFPDWIKRTDEERIENCTWILENKTPFVKTEKLDGTSTTIFLDRTQRKPDFGVCSRNVRQIDIDQKNYHSQDIDGNVYWEMALKYNMREVLEKIANWYNVNRLVLQGETYGASLQGNPYKLEDRRFAAFNLIFDGERLGSIEAKKILEKYDIPFVPIIDESYILPDDFEEFKLSADGVSTINPKCRREGFVYRSLDGKQSFKNVSREFLLKKKE